MFIILMLLIPVELDADIGLLMLIALYMLLLTLLEVALLMLDMPDVDGGIGPRCWCIDDCCWLILTDSWQLLESSLLGEPGEETITCCCCCCGYVKHTEKGFFFWVSRRTYVRKIWNFFFHFVQFGQFTMSLDGDDNWVMKHHLLQFGP